MSLADWFLLANTRNICLHNFCLQESGVLSHEASGASLGLFSFSPFFCFHFLLWSFTWIFRNHHCFTASIHVALSTIWGFYSTAFQIKPLPEEQRQMEILVFNVKISWRARQQQNGRQRNKAINTKEESNGCHKRNHHRKMSYVSLCQARLPSSCWKVKKETEYWRWPRLGQMCGVKTSSNLVSNLGIDFLSLNNALWISFCGDTFSGSSAKVSFIGQLLSCYPWIGAALVSAANDAITRQM